VGVVRRRKKNKPSRIKRGRGKVKKTREVTDKVSEYSLFLLVPRGGEREGEGERKKIKCGKKEEEAATICCEF